MTPENTDSVEKAKRGLAQLFRHAFDGRASASLVYEVGEKIGSRLNNLSEEQMPKELSDALEFVHGLHDQSARTYYSEHREDFNYHMRRLLE
ncbi:hypothetical protein CO038_01450 [Candidatus Pacearchaeota archaeon CG_4_9_14_0_2_um_filter_39_13]|nr:hypothetical protein [Candidatus Pacearchaeota archaeon]OIO43779.1 MAG: hypothetical protein AUJ64_01705 [Candidatus Pacearchaeota archaeon CG1_02_39_14]PJC44874.1 MAG: hypothetical protein CO038_01450 [Candidatus Pacearchaeota archaeon CG_4_9_14_0_2_um_filter_39_13]